jgi:hypothetical protein
MCVVIEIHCDLPVITMYHLLAIPDWENLEVHCDMSQMFCFEVVHGKSVHSLTPSIFCSSTDEGSRCSARDQGAPSFKPASNLLLWIIFIYTLTCTADLHACDWHCKQVLLKDSQASWQNILESLHNWELTACYETAAFVLCVQVFVWIPLWLAGVCLDKSRQFSHRTRSYCGRSQRS